MKLKFLSQSMFSKLRATWLLRRGMLRAKLRQNVLAIEDYTAVIEMSAAPAGVKAMSLYNRALVYHATNCKTKSIEDLNKVLAMAGAAVHVKAEARRKLIRMRRTSERADTRE